MENFQEINHGLQQSIKESTHVTESMNKYLEESRGIYKEVYFQIAIVAGATISLSINYVGNLNKTAGTIIYPWLLISSWVLLGISMILGILRNKLHTDMGHWQLLKARNEKLLNVERETIKFIEAFPDMVSNINTQQDKETLLITKRKNAGIYEKSVAEISKDEKRVTTVWKLSEKITLITFFLGVTALVTFASINLLRS